MEGSTTIGAALNTGLTTNVKGTTIVTEFISILPWVGTMVGAAFVIYEAKKMIKGASKGKVRL